MTKEVSQAPSPLPPCSHHNALPWSVLEVLLHNRGAQSLSFSCCHNIPTGAPQNGPVSSRAKPAAQPGWFWGVQGLTQTPATSLCVSHQRQCTLLGCPRISMVERTHLSVPISTSPPSFPGAGGHSSQGGFGGAGLTSRGAGLVRGCRGCRGSAASGSGCSETSCKARRAGAVSVGDGWRWWPLGATVPWVWRGPGAQSGGDMGWGGGQARKVRQSRRGAQRHCGV